MLTPLILTVFPHGMFEIVLHKVLHIALKQYAEHFLVVSTANGHSNVAGHVRRRLAIEVLLGRYTLEDLVDQCAQQ